MYVPWQRLKVSTKYLPCCYNIGDFMHAEIGKDSAGQKNFFQTVKRRKSLMLKLFASDYNM
jgi:hypothetical protein